MSMETARRLRTLADEWRDAGIIEAASRATMTDAADAPGGAA